MNTKSLLVSLLLILALTASANIKLASVLGDNMVLQRNTEVKIWGTASPNQKIQVKSDWINQKVATTANEKGDWMVKLKTTEAGGPYKITISSGKEVININNILLGEVWLCSGQSNMEMPISGFQDQPINGSNHELANAYNPQIRFFTVKRKSINTPQDTCTGNWQIANSQSVAKFSATAYFFAQQLQKTLQIPVGLVHSSWGGSRIEAWIDSETMKKFPESLKSTTQEKTAPNQRASYLYNGMINPIKNYTIKGAIWYQGESNRGEYQYYAELMNAMIGKWKTDFELKELPFYFVQIAPYRYENSNEILSGKFYDEQYKASQNIPNTGIVATVDFGEEGCIHPAEKKIVGQRLSYWALAKTYGYQGIEYKSPTMKSYEVKDSAFVVSFDNSANGLTAYGKEITNFEIAGEDKVFYPAVAKIKSKQLVLTSTSVKKPVAARYAYVNYPTGKGFLYNIAGLPVLPFRTDNW